MTSSSVIRRILPVLIVAMLVTAPCVGLVGALGLGDYPGYELRITYDTADQVNPAIL